MSWDRQATCLLRVKAIPRIQLWQQRLRALPQRPCLALGGAGEKLLDEVLVQRLASRECGGVHRRRLRQ